MGSSLRRSHRAWLLKVSGVLATCLAAGLVTAGVVSGTDAIASLSTGPEDPAVEVAPPDARCVGTGGEALSANRSSYTPGAAVSIGGDGFEPSCLVGVRITLPDGSVSLEDVTTTEDGALDSAYATPNPAVPGSYLVEALGADDAVLATAGFEGRPAAGDGPVIWTNKNDYVPGEMVVVLGSGFEPGETVDLRLNGTPVLHGERSFSATVDAAGAFEFTEFRPDELDIGVSFVLSATGRTSGIQAETTFTDAITLGSSTTNHNGDPAATELTLQVPAFTAGDLLLAHVTVEGLGTSQQICTPAGGWASVLRTNNSSSTSQQIFRKVASASEPTSYTFQLRTNGGSCGTTSNGVAKGAVGGMTAFAGVDTATTNGIFGSAGATGTSTTINSPTVGAAAPPSANVPVGSGVVRYFGNDKEFQISTTGGGSSQTYFSRRNKSGGGFEKPSGAAAFGTQASAGATLAVTGSNGNNGGNWVAQTIVLRVAANGAPSGTNKAITIAEDTSHTFTASDFGFTDPDSGDTMSAVRIDTLSLAAGATLKLSGSNVAAGQVILTGAIPNLVFAPAANASGTPYSSFTFSVRDTNGLAFDTSPNTITLNVTAVDDPPVAVDDTRTVAEDSGASTVNVLANDTDVDGGPKTIASVTQPANGTVGIAGDSLSVTYEPAANYCNGGSPTDDFTYTLNGGSTADVAVTVTCVNDAPVCADVEIETDEDTTGSTPAECTDVEGNTLTYAAAPAGVGVSGVDGDDLTYDPNGQFEHLDDGEGETDSFTYTANDGNVDSAPADVDVTIDGVNDAPTCDEVEITTDEDTPGSAPAECTDVDGELLTYTATAAAVGLSGVDGSDLTFDPNGQFESLDDGENGTDAFTYTANDGTVDSAAADVDVTITGLNDAPVCADVPLTVSEDGPAASGAPDCTDAEDDPLTYGVSAAGAGVSGLASGPLLTYDPAGAFEHLDDGEPGSDGFTYTANDGDVDSDPANVPVTIDGANDAPVCADVAIATDEDTADSAASDCTDVDDEPLTYAVTSPAAGVSGVDGSDLTYDPNGQFEHLDDSETASDDFTYTANDGTVDSAPADVDVTVDGVNDAPTCASVEITTDEDTPGSAPAECTDVDGELLTYTATAAAVGLSGVDGDDLTFDPNGQFESLDDGENGTDAFTYTANDGTVDSAAADVDVTITGLNDAPVCADVAITTEEDTADSTGADCTDVDDEALTYAVTSPAAGVSGVDGSDLTYDPAGQFEHLDDGETASDDFTYTANDGTVDSAAADVDVTVDGVNDAPVCTDVAITTDEDTADSTASDCTDAEDDPLTYAAGPAGTGVSGVTDSDLTYDPNGQFEHLGAGETGSDSFTYTANDGDVDSASANVSVTIDGVNDAPVCTDVSITTDEDTPGSTASDCTDAEGDDLMYAAGSAGTGDSGVAGSDLTYDPAGQFEHLDDGETGNDSFTYTANDGDVDSAPANVSVTIDGINDAPVCGDVAISTDEDTADSTASDCTDAEDDPLTYVAGAASAGVSGVTGSDLTYDPNGQFEHLGSGDTATDGFTYTASDGDVDSAAGNVAVTITGVNDEPAVELTGPVSANEGETKTYQLDTTDPDSTTFALDAHACGEGASVVADSLDFDTATGDGSFDCLFADDDPTATPFDTAEVSATVSDGEASDGDTVDVTVANRAPSVVVASPMSGTYPVGASITVIAPFTDAGTADSHTCTVNGVAGTIDYSGPGAGTCKGTASPSVAGAFTITVVVTDDDTGSASAGSVVNVLYAIYAHEKCSGGSGKGLIVNGPDADIDGGMHSNGNFKVDGQNFQSGTASLYRPQSGCTTSYNPARVNFGPPSATAPVNVPLKSWPWNPVKADFTCTFTKDEFIFNKAGQVIPSGVYCANKLFKINASNVSGIITVIAPEVVINGKNIDLFPHSKDVLLLGTGTKEIVLDGDLTPDTVGGFTGLVHNAGGGVKVNGQAITTYRSYIQGLWVEINLKGFRMRY